MTTDWSPEQKLRADATDDEIVARLYGYVPFSTEAKKVASVAREFASACIAAKRHDPFCPSHPANVACTCEVSA